MPFALNAATRFISPTKTLEYLAGGKPVVSTPIHDVIHPYGEHGLVQIEGSAAGFEAAIDRILDWDNRTRQRWLNRVDATLRQLSWDNTWSQMKALMDQRFPVSPLQT
jgi:UDP-galactopyranose mutase